VASRRRSETGAGTGPVLYDRRRRESSRGTARRVAIAIPLALFAILIIQVGGALFAVSVIGFGVLSLHELYRMLAPVRPIALAGFASVAALVLAAQYGDQFQVVLVLAVSLLVTFALALARPERRHVTLAIASTLLGVSWIGLTLAHAVLLRGLDHGGGLLADTLIGTFIGDTGAYFGGRLWGMRPLAPRVSPSKTVEGLVVGVLVGTVAFWFAGLYQNWLSGIDALVIGIAVALAAPLGDLFESLVKRDLEVKDASRVFGEHGGVLDRLDAALFAVVASYYVTRAVF
jgi:phosphatidate cytidylyltransferase